MYRVVAPNGIMPKSRLPPDGTAAKDIKIPTGFSCDDESRSESFKTLLETPALPGIHDSVFTSDPRPGSSSWLVRARNPALRDLVLRAGLEDPLTRAPGPPGHARPVVVGDQRGVTRPTRHPARSRLARAREPVPRLLFGLRRVRCLHGRWTEWEELVFVDVDRLDCGASTA